MSADRKYLINAQMLGGIELDGNSAYTKISAADAIGAVDTELSGGINGANLISAINSAYAAASGNEPGAPANSVQYNNGSDGFAGSEYWLISEVASGAVSTMSGSFSLTGSDSSLSVSGQSSFNGVADFAAGQTIAANQFITGQGAMGVGSVGALSVSSQAAVTVEAGVGNIILEMADGDGANEVRFTDSGSVRVAGIDSDGNADFGGTLDVTGLSTIAGLDASGAGDFAGDLSVATSKFTVAALSGDTDIAGTLVVTGESTLASATVSDLTSGRVVLAGIAGAVEDSANLAFDGSTLAVTGAGTFSTTLGVTGESTLASATVSDLTSGRVVLAGTAGAIEDSANLAFDGSTLAVTGAGTFSTTLGVTGVATFTAQSVHSAGANMNSVGIINAGPIAGATTVDASGAITGGSFTDGTCSITGGAISAATTIAATDMISTTSTEGFKLRGTDAATGAAKNYQIQVIGGILVATESAV